MYSDCQKKIQVQLEIDIELFFKKLDDLPQQKPLNENDKIIICGSLLGKSKREIADMIKNSSVQNLSEQNIRSRLAKSIYAKIAELMKVEQEEIAGNWVKILNCLVNPKNGYKLNLPPQLNNDNFQGSFGGQVFHSPPNQEIVELQIEAARFYQQGLYYQAVKCFLDAWEKGLAIYGVGNPEILIYINNCLLEYKKSLLQERGIKIYTLAVVVPFYHNQGQVAAETLRGVAQMQLQVNLQSFEAISLEKEISLAQIKPKMFFSLHDLASPIALKIFIVNDPNNLYDPYNQTAENLVQLAPKLNLLAVIGHYSSEMTAKALDVYTKHSILLVNSSSTSNEFSLLTGGEALSFYRLTTPDCFNAKRLADYLLNAPSKSTRKKVAIIYNQNSSYSQSYKTSVKRYLEQQQEQFTFLAECGYISENYAQIQAYLENIKQNGVDLIIIIPDGGIEPSSLNNVGLISRLNLKHCLIAGSATFFHNNVLHWIEEQSQYHDISPGDCQIVACIPWHWDSQQNGSNSSNSLGQHFCQIGTQLWGEENLTWRSATAFDSVLVILKILAKDDIQGCQSLLIKMNQYFKEEKKQVKGVTGIIEFDQQGNRINPPTEIVAVSWNEQQQQWKWEINKQ
ncbi:MAG: ABC transporter substrate-binding protein [Symploca sp. SIO2D2]|nr:ABC transporter substrate-binding protein [Symploca sp. SIO2D2]